MKTLYIGIDCGAKGAVAFVSSESVKVFDMPTNSNGIVDTYGLYIMIQNNIGGKTIIGIEEQGVKGNLTSRKSAFIMGRNYQAVINAVQDTTNASIIYIKPQQWKKTLGVLGTSAMSVNEKKKITAELVKDVFPNADIFGKRGGLKDGRADALAIAEYLRRKY